MKKLFLLTLIFFSLFSLRSFALDTCTGASMCGGSYSLNCNSVSDGYCPSNYGDWNSCGYNAFGGLCTTTCDPDCTNCELTPTETVNIGCNPQVSDPGSKVTVTATASGTDAVGDQLKAYKGQLATGTPWNSITCTTNPCTLSSQDTAPSQGGAIFYYTATTNKLWNYNGFSVTTSCLTKPLCDININPTRTQGSKKFISGIATVTLSVSSNAGVQRKELYFYKWNKNLKVFSPMTPPEQGCSIQQCNFVDCNKLSFGPGSTSTYTWDTTKCENGDYSLTMNGIDNNNNSCTDSDQATIEGSTICVDECSIFSSKTLNTILVKIKSWI